MLALLSAFNAQIYSSSRLVYSLARRGELPPRALTATNKENVPHLAVIVSMVFAFISVGLQVVFSNTSVLTFLLNAVGGCLLVLWIMIALSQIKLPPIGGLRRAHRAHVAIPYLSWVAVLMLVGLGILMLTDPSTSQQILAVLAVVIFLVIVAALTRRSRAIARGNCQ